MDRKFYQYLLFSIIVCLGGGWLTGLVTKQGVKDWYPSLIHPVGTPPDIVFPIVWTILYLLMAISLTFILSAPSKNKHSSLFLFALQLVLNFSWSWLFFGMRSPAMALIDIILLWVCIVATIFSFKKHSKASAYLLLPYLAWVTYAFYLNLFIWIKNP